MKARQLSLFGKIQSEYGGEKSVGKRKIARPFDPRQAVHATFRASIAKAGTAYSMKRLPNKAHIYGEAWRIAEESDVKIYYMVNVGNHIHIVLKTRARKSLQRFLRVFAGRVAMMVLGTRKGHSTQAAVKQDSFWDFPVHTKIIAWGRHYDRLVAYMKKNLKEAEGPRFTAILPWGTLTAAPS